MTKGPGDRRRGPPDLAINRDQRGPGDQGTGDCDALTKGTGGPEGTGDCDALTKGTRGDQQLRSIRQHRLRLPVIPSENNSRTS